MEFQKVNHFPGTFVIGRKDRLTNTLSRALLPLTFFFFFFLALYVFFSRQVSRVHLSIFSLFSSGFDGRWVGCAGFKRRVGKADVQFYPRTHILPAEYEEFKEDFKESHGLWIWKPPASARGIGIKLVTKLSQVGPRPGSCSVLRRSCSVLFGVAPCSFDVDRGGVDDRWHIDARW